MATASIQRALTMSEGLKIEGDERVALILGSGSGELEASADFLATWAKINMARPVLFQNSLHNASTGFASIQFKIVGPSFTVSAGESTPQECIEMARGLMNEDLADVCIVTLVEGHKSLSEQIGMPGIREGACTLILSREPYISARGLRSRWDLSEPQQYVPEAKDHPLIDVENGGIFPYVRGLETSVQSSSPGHST